MRNFKFSISHIKMVKHTQLKQTLIFSITNYTYYHFNL